MHSSAISAAFISACEDELLALKPGNAHVHSNTHKLSVEQFRTSACVSAPALTRRGAAIGTRILDAVGATQAAVGTNTNLGIILLCAPLAAAAESLAAGSVSALQAALAAALDALTVDDAEQAFRAIALAAPGGLGADAANDVHEPARVTLKAAMAGAAARDRIAYQYTHGFADVFGRGLVACGEAEARTEPGWRDPQWRTLLVYLTFLAAFDDSHILRRHGAATAQATRLQAAKMLEGLQAAIDPQTLVPDLLAFDSGLKAQGINPGTSADLTVATLFVRRFVR